MTVPPWLTLLVAGMVIAFGLYRFRLAFRSDQEDERARQRKGLYSLPRRTHALFGVLYLLLGLILVAGMLGLPVNPFRMLAPQQTQETPQSQPTGPEAEGIPVNPRTGAD
jgi:cytochrome b561